MDRDLYKDLGVPGTATQADLKTAWRAASKRHPDQGGDPERFMRAKLAYDFLADPGRRAKYDAARTPGPSRKATRDAKKAFNHAWDTWAATLGELLPHLQAMRGAARGSDWRPLAEASLGLASTLLGCAPKPKQEENTGDLAFKLRQLKAAHSAGLLTDDEYKGKRSALLAAF